jgi:hypothetical protein
MVGVHLGVNEDVTPGPKLIYGHSHNPAIDLRNVTMELRIVPELNFEAFLVPGFSGDVGSPTSTIWCEPKPVVR